MRWTRAFVAASANKQLWIGLACLAPVWILLMWAGTDPFVVNTANADAPAFTDAFPLGTDELGRDIMARLAHATLQSLRVATQAVMIALLVAYLSAWGLRRSLPAAAPVIQRIVTGLLIAVWMVPFIYASMVISTSGHPAKFARSALIILPVIAAAAAILLIRKEDAFLPETAQRDRWTGTGWRIARLLTSVAYLPVIAFVFIGVAPFLYRLNAPFPTSIVIGCTLAVFLFRTALSAPHAIVSGLFSSLAWALLAGFYLAATGLGAGFESLVLGGMFARGHPMAFSASIVVLVLLVAGLVITGDWIRKRFD
jgi:ABC-type dipeptide/oligopeptide/nickel transport system permease subunit